MSDLTERGFYACFYCANSHQFAPYAEQEAMPLVARKIAEERLAAGNDALEKHARLFVTQHGFVADGQCACGEELGDEEQYITHLAAAIRAMKDTGGRTTERYLEDLERGGNPA